MTVVSQLRARARIIGVVGALVLGAVGANHVAAQAGDEAHVSKAGPVPLPAVSVRRVGDHLLVRYRFRSWPSDPRRHPAALLISSKSAGTRYPPLTQSYRVRQRSGRIRHPVGLGSPPFTLLYSVYSQRGMRSRTATKPVP
jgi:hypothetical protein